jgi:hypothetical protein
MITSVSFVGSSSEVNSHISFNHKPAESGWDFDDLFDEISYDLKIEGAPDLLLQDGRSTYNITSNFNLSNNFDPIAKEDDFTDLYDGVSKREVLPRFA